MEKAKSSPNKFLVIVSLIVIFIPVYIQGLSILVFNMKDLSTPAEKIAYFLKLFPSFLQKSNALSIVCLLSSAFTFFISIYCLSRTSGVLKILSIIALVLSSLLGALSLFQMM